MRRKVLISTYILLLITVKMVDRTLPTLNAVHTYS